MKLNRKNIIPILLFFSLSILAYGFIKKVVLKVKAENVPSKIEETKKSSFILKKNVLQTTPEQEIIGVWTLENDPSSKIEFTADGKEKWYEDNVLKYVDSYTISNECGGNVSETDLLYLTTIDGEDASERCDVIMNGVYEPNSTTLTLLDENGRLAIFKRP
jgi:hypothetical protein